MIQSTCSIASKLQQGGGMPNFGTAAGTAFLLQTFCLLAGGVPSCPLPSMAIAGLDVGSEVVLDVGSEVGSEVKTDVGPECCAFPFGFGFLPPAFGPEVG